MKDIKNFSRWKKNVTIMCAIMEQKLLAESGHSTRIALYIFNTLRMLLNNQFKKQEIKLECMN